MRHDPYRSNGRQSLLPVALGFAALLVFGAETARSETPGPASSSSTESSFSDAACEVCEVQYEQCGPQLHLGLCIDRYVRCLRENYCEADAAGGPFATTTSTASGPLSQTPTD